MRAALSAATTGFLLGILFSIPMLGLVTEDRAPSEPTGTPDVGVQLYEEYDCWIDDGKEHPMPAGALVTLPGREPAIYPADVGFGIWLEGDPGVLHAFCARGPSNLDTQQSKREGDARAAQ